MPVCTKMISSWVWEVLSIAEGHMSPGNVQVPTVPLALAADVYVVSILQASVSNPARHQDSRYIITMDWLQSSVHCAVLNLNE